MKKLLFVIALLLTISSVAALEFPPGAQKMMDYQNQIALSVTFLIAFLGGILAFTSPCGFVVIPTFFAYLFKERKRAMFMTATFCAGMTIAFIIFGLIAGLVGNFFNEYKEFFSMFAGILLILFGFMLVFNQGFSLFDFKVKHKPNHGWGVFFLGLFFAIGWTPCVGPILGGIIVLATGVGSIYKAAILFGFYALGVSLPLLIVSYFSDKYDVSKWFTSKHIEFTLFGKKIYTHLYGIIGGTLLILVGMIMIYFKGTRVFMSEIPKHLPWTMDLFTRTNEWLVASHFFTSTAANIVGIIVALILIGIMWKAIKHHHKE